jgi:hypothetical protein
LRHFIIYRAQEGTAAWVLAETPDRDWALDQALAYSPTVTLSRDEAMLDPDYREAMEAWDHRDDSGYQAYAALLDADGALDAATMEMTREGIDVPEEPDPEWHGSEEQAMFFEHCIATSMTFMNHYVVLKGENPELANAFVRYCARDSKKMADRVLQGRLV